MLYSADTFEMNITEYDAYTALCPACQCYFGSPNEVMGFLNIAISLGTPHAEVGYDAFIHH